MTHRASSQILESAGGEIGRVVDVIAGLANQTNLLTLNATIEAARVGELGRGFGVVAEDVKNLAKSSAAASEQINDHVRSIAAGTNTAVEGIASISEAVTQIDNTQSAIAAAVEEQTATTAEISRALQSVSHDSASAGARLDQIAAQTINLHGAVGETQEVAARLTVLSADLEAMVGGSNVDAGSTPRVRRRRLVVAATRSS